MGRKMIERTYPEELLWIKGHKKVLNIIEIERKLGITKGTLWRFIEDRMGLNEKWWPKIVEFVRDLREEGM